MLSAMTHISRIALAVVTLLAACSSGTDITRTDDDVEDWVAEQKAAEKDAKARGSKLPQPAPQPVARPATPPQGPTPWPKPCTAEWYQLVEREVGVADAQGHGPDPGSTEWMSAVEHRLGIRDDASFPEPGTPTWCDRIDQLVAQKHHRP